jgi:hypothetical protein
MRVAMHSDPPPILGEPIRDSRADATRGAGHEDDAISVPARAR